MKRKKFKNNSKEAEATESKTVELKAKFKLCAYKPLIVGFILFVFGLTAGWLLCANFSKLYSGAKLSTLRLKGDYKFISPLLVCDTNSKDSEALKPLQNKVSDIIRTAQDKKQITTASVYMRDVATGNSFDINPEEKFFPASLNKIPVMIAYYQMAEEDPTILTKKVTYSGGPDSNANQEITPKDGIKVGETYTIDQLIEKMIKYSDNNAFYLLVGHIDQKYLEQRYNDLKINLPADNSVVDYMSASDFSYFLRVLYNATYLSRDLSEKALQLLGEVDYKDGLNAGLPGDVAISHKFGLRTDYNSDGSLVNNRELHDCGIIYGQRPYLLCVMTKSGSGTIPQIQDVIKNISSAVYNDMESGK